MVTEFDVRQQMNEIERSAMHPMRKARRFLILTRNVRSAVRKFQHGVDILARVCMDDEANRLQNSSERLVDLAREVKDKARLTLARARESRS